jgi:hypothetical protein
LYVINGYGEKHHIDDHHHHPEEIGKFKDGFLGAQLNPKRYRAYPP